MILHDIYSNSTLVEALKNRTKGEMIIDRTRAMVRMKLCGITPTLQLLDNEASSAYTEAIRKSEMTHQLVLTDEHRRNLA